MMRLFSSIFAGLFMLTAPAFARGAPESFAPLVEKLTPAVVNISTTQKVKQKKGEMAGMPFMFQLPDDPQFDPFRQFFDQLEKQQGGRGGMAKPKEREVTSLGSGFIIDAAGYVVTNNHVIAEADEVSVILQDDTSLKAKVVGRDPKTDLALLKVESKEPLPFVRFGGSDSVRVGDWIMAIGNPFGLGGTVTAGIISARSRSINAGPFDDFLQTDAAINRGNSGGPMFNMDGEVIGINTAIFSPSGGNVGIGFAVPSALAKPVLDQLREHGRTYRGWLGVKIQEVTDEMASAVGLTDAAGALVLEITKDSPAAKTDLKPGDIILSFDGKPVTGMRKLPRIVAETKVSKEVAIAYYRDGKKRSTSVILGELDETSELADGKDAKPKADMPAGVKTKKLVGLELATIDGVMRKKYRLPEALSGVLIVDIKNDSAAAKQNLRIADIIVRINDQEIKVIADVENALSSARKAGRDYALTRLIRDKNELFTTIPTGK
ncbi:MAG: DegQ family serine endoprotease [Rickettsiales bacterium]|nr:DegQ family serine endoprotease [Rickettsiales bacterium]